MATNARIEKVTAAKFRGASRTTSLSFDASKRFILLFGENGTGKSTIIDAIDMVCNQAAGTLEHRSPVKASEHLPTIGSKATDLNTEVTFGGKTWRASLKGEKIGVSPDGNIPPVTILRRHKVLKLVEATPSDRFDELKRFIDVDNVQKGEDALPKAIKEAKIVIEERTRELSTSESNLKLAFDEESTPQERSLTPQEWAKQRVEANLTTLQGRVMQIKSVIDAYASAKTLLDAKNSSKKDLDSKRAIEQDVKNKIEALKFTDTQTSVILVDLLNKATEFLKKRPDAGECPVCLQPVTGQDLAQAIQDRLGQMTELKMLAGELAEASKDVQNAFEITRKGYVDLIGKASDLAKKTENLPNDYKKLLTLDKSQYPNPLTWDQKSLTKEIIAETDRFMETVAPVVTTLQTEHDALNKQANQLNGIKRDYDTSLRARKEAERAMSVQKIFEEMRRIVRKERIAFSQEILDGIADECDRLYSLIHPDEKLGGVRFALDQEKKGSLFQIGQFQGHKNVVPQAYFSDSHLDTLAFCFFVAVTRKTVGNSAVVIIDDVFTSVDLQHIRRILDVLLEESKKFSQIILATHQRRWLDLFLTQQVPANDAHIVQLRPWSIDTGVCGDTLVPHLDDLKTLLGKSPINRREIGSLSGFLIEGILGEMTKHLNCSIKRNPRDRYTAHDVLCSMATPSMTLRIQKLNSSGSMALVSDGPPSFRELVADLVTMVNDVRNTVGDHFNWDAAEITDAIVLDFGQKTKAACRMLLCDHCGGMAMKNKETHLQCGCGNMTIHKK